MKSRKELIKGAVPLFKKHEVSELHATTDGQYFLDRNRADLHARSSKKLKVYTIEESDTDGENQNSKSDDQSGVLSGNARSSIEAVKSVGDVKVLNQYLKEEKEDKNRSTVIKAIESQIESINELGTGGNPDSTKDNE